MVPLTRILVPTDFSAASDAALVCARSLARPFGASINLVHVLEDPFASGVFIGDGSVILPLDLRRSLEESAREQLRLRQAEHIGTLPHSWIDLLLGSAASRIVEHADRTGADLIVMGTHGRTALGHLLLGSVAEKVVRKAGCPVLTAKEPAPRHAPPDHQDARLSPVERSCHDQTVDLRPVNA